MCPFGITCFSFLLSQFVFKKIIKYLRKFYLKKKTEAKKKRVHFKKVMCQNKMSF